MSIEPEITVKMEVIEDGVKKTIELTSEYVGKNGEVHFSHINALDARKMDKVSQRDEELS